MSGSTAAVERVCRVAADRHGDVETVVDEVIETIAPLVTGAERARLRAAAIARLAGLDVIDGFLADDDVDEVMIVAGRHLWVERNGTIASVGQLAAGVLDAVLERALAPLGRRLDRTSPIVDARLAGGHRLCAIVPPVAVDGPAVAIRRHRRRPIPLARFAPPDVAGLLLELVARRSNLVISGATSSGKTTLLAALLDELDAHERIVLVEDTAELVLDHPHLVRLEARPPSAEGVPEIDPVDLVRAALRLRPDRLIVGEFRGAEVLAVLHALHTGHRGSLSTCHANDAADALRRVETLALQAAPTWPLAAIRHTVTSAIDAIVHVGRSASGARSVVEVVEVVEVGDGVEGGEVADRGHGGRAAVRPLVRDGAAVGRPERRRR